MQALSQYRHTFDIPLGHRRGKSDLARFALDLTWATADSASAARSAVYPSPPMSGSPPLPPKSSQEVTDRAQTFYQTTSTTTAPAPTPIATSAATTAATITTPTPAATAQDAFYPRYSSIQGELRPLPGTTTPPAPATAPAPAPPPARTGPFAAEAPERMSYSFPRHESSMPRPLSYPPQHGQVMNPYLPMPGGLAAVGPGPGPMSGPLPPTYSPSSHQAPQEIFPQTSPKIQRKTKGHVISACVPCKKAHLRCDTQRPCSRCMSNGKEELCIDVQHKKRGRPRLRDDRETRYDSASRFGGAPDPLMRRPVSLYAPGAPGSSSMGMTYDDNIRRSQSYRVLKSQPAESLAPRFPERGSVADANIFPPPLSISTGRAPEPAAFLTMDFEIAKASSTFSDAIGRHSVQGLKLTDLLVPSDRDKAAFLHRQMQDEQKNSSSSYLPRIVGKDDEVRVIQALGFSPEEMARFPLEQQVPLTFLAQNNRSQSFHVRLGLAKEDSISFIVLSLSPASQRHFQPPTPSPSSRDIPYSYQPLQPAFSHPTPTSATFEPRHGYGSRPPPPPPMSAGLSPGIPGSYAASPGRVEYSMGQSSYQIPRSELHPPSHSSQAPGYQLPPIRSQQPGTPQHPSPISSSSYQTRDDRSRVDIGGLIEHPDPSKRPHQ